jgi:uncharacterized membrane protein
MLPSNVDQNIYLKMIWMTRTTLSLPIGTKIIIFIFSLSGTFHLVNPGFFEALVPPVLGNELFWIVFSGILEIVCAIGLLTKQKWAPKLTAAVLLVIWVGNWWYAIDVTWNLESSWLLILGSWLRLPLQIPLIQWALRSPVKTI